MKNITRVLIVLTIFICSCQATKTSVIQYCKICLDVEDGIIVDDLNSPLLSERRNNDLRVLIIAMLQSEGMINVYDKYELDYEFLTNNIIGIESTEDREQLNRKLNIKYILKPTVLNLREAEGYDVIYPSESIYPIPRSPQLNRSLLEFELIETATEEVVYKVAFNNSDKEYSKNNEDDIEFFNFGSSFRTLWSGAKKGSKFTVADCTCPKGKYLKRRKFWEKIGF
ncbi:hypothetical protein Belba_1643 [Belliella baltica DSM 15883]|uniref:Uncharacterized protein n=1 Tax=Belliella baltica (strain DSM 15883 / CIP 108006 / LMG 21964 / BA134) TaxID=866536 RepID=I3Z4T1_BELBD|nr:hypothetical protein [Belliella baltica]AFL84249.1 hypothetical protein Belba_1643 [Belliella baltica DSM 15883]